jgi:hypothetical protein
MAETLGIVTSILQLVEAALKAREYIEDFRNAPQEQQKLLSEMDNLRPLLKELQSHIAGSSVAAVRFRTDSEPELNPNRTSIQVQALAKDRTEPQVRFGVRRLLDFSGPVRTCPNLCEPQIFFASNNNIHQKEIAYANLLGVNRGVVTALEPKGGIK